jgi:hypothetical protein
VRRLIWGIGMVLLIGSLQAQRQPGVPDVAAMQALWAGVKSRLSAPDGEKYFEDTLKDTQFPHLCGLVLSATPKDNPDLLVLAMSDKSMPEVSLKLDRRATESIREGDEIIFEGAARSFTRQPFRLTIITSDLIRIHDPRQRSCT